MDEATYMSMSGEPSVDWTSAIAGGVYGGAPTATDEFGNVMYGDTWYGDGTTWEDVYGSQAPPTPESDPYYYGLPPVADVPSYYDPSLGLDGEYDPSIYTQGFFGSGSTTTPLADHMYGTTGSVGLTRGVIGGAAIPNAQATPQASLYYPSNPLDPLNNPPQNYDTTGTLAGEPWFQQGQDAARAKVMQPKLDAANAANAAAAVAKAAADLPNVEEPLNREELRKKQAADFDAKKKIADAEWRAKQARLRGGVQQMGPPRMAQGGGMARPGPMRMPQMMGGGGRAAGMPNLARPLPPGVGGVAGAAGGGGAAQPKQNTAPLKQLLNEWKSSYQEAKKANEDRYAEILKGFRQNTVDVLGQNDTQAASAKEDVQRAYDRAAADAIQSAIGRGLNNTTVRDSLSRGVESDRQRAIRGIENDRITRMTQLMNQLKNQELGFMERRDDTYPSMELMAQLATKIGEADPYGQYDYADLLGATKKA